jgi:hypothetical protein
LAQLPASTPYGDCKTAKSWTDASGALMRL